MAEVKHFASLVRGGGESANAQKKYICAFETYNPRPPRISVVGGSMRLTVLSGFPPLKARGEKGEGKGIPLPAPLGQKQLKTMLRVRHL